MAGKAKKETPGLAPDRSRARLQEQTTAMNERLIVSAIHQHELREIADKLNAQLQAAIVEHENTEAALRESEREIKAARDYAEAILRAAPVPFLVLRADLRVDTASEAFYKDFQVEPAATEGELIYEIGNGQWNIPRLRELLEEIIPRRNVFNGFEVTHTFASIGERTMLLNARRVDNAAGVPDRILLAIEDITERTQAAEALRASAEFNRSIIESSRDCVKVLDLEGRLTLMSEGGQRLLCIPDIAPLLGTSWLELWTGKDRAAAEVALALASAGGTGSFTGLYATQGEPRWWDVIITPILNSRGEPEKLLAVTRDVTERVSSEQMLRAGAEDLARAGRAKDDFLAALSHELRTPLTPVLMSAAALREDERLPADVRDQLSMMERNIALEARLIDDLLDLTRIAHGKLSLRTQPCDAHNLIELAVEMVRSDAEGKGQKLEVDLAAERSHLIGDPARLQQVFWNLLNNAVKFTPESGQLSVRSHDAGEHLALEIRDSGIGISAESIERIFLPFEQAGAVSAEHRIGGLGLGLSIVKAIVDLHGGSIRAASDGLGEGSTFSLELPATEPPPESAVGSAAPAAGDAGASPRVRAAGLRLLLVDDHQSTLDVLERLLTRAGHRVTTAMSVANARKLAGSERFDAVISDLGLPDGTGYELMETLRAAHGLRGIALSGYGMDDDLRRSEEAGFSAHLTKPIDFAQLERALERLMAEA